MQTLSKFRWLALLTSLFIVAFSLPVTAKKAKKLPAANPVLWRNPGNISKRNLFYGPGSPSLAPVPPFRFLKEDKEGDSPKFDVEDSRGVKWRIKLGPEAQAETAATRLVWAVGYNTEEAYYFDRVRIDNLPRLSRGRQYVLGNLVRGARFEPRRENVERGPRWDWANNPFRGTRELDGLKVLMVLLNNWDVRKNNTILYVKDPNTKHVEAQYTVTDLGAVLGANGAILGRHRSKSNIQDFQKARFVRKIENGKVKFDYDIKPQKLGLITIFYPPYFFGQRRANNIMHEVPIEHAAWIGLQLAQLSDQQLRDGFRAAGYDRQLTESYVRALRKRIDQLTQMSLPENIGRRRTIGR
jgi:hypothetical protein